MTALACPAPTGPQIERVLTHWTTRCTRPVLRGGLRVYHRARRVEWSTSGVLHVPVTAAPFLLAANHQSHLDTAAVIATLPPAIARKLVVAAAADTFAPRRSGFWNDPRRATLAWLVAAGFGAFPFDRGVGARRSLRAAAHLLRSGRPLLVYPEGTRSRTGAMAPFKPGVAWLAERTGARVVPVHVDGSGALLPWDGTRPAAGRVHVSYGPALQLLPDESRAAFTARVEAAVRHLGTERRQAQPAPATGKSGSGGGGFAEIEGARRPAGRHPVPR